MIPPARRHISDALHADRSLDLVLVDYAEHGRPADLAVAIDLTRRLHTALTCEAARIHRADLITVARPPEPASPHVARATRRA